MQADDRPHRAGQAAPGTLVSWHVFALTLAVGLFLFDFQNLLALWGGRTLAPHRHRSDDFTIIVPLYGHPRYFADRDHLRRYQANVLVAMDTSSRLMLRFANELEREGWRVCRLNVEDPSPPILMHKALPFVETTYVLRMDADTRPIDFVSSFIGSMERDGADVCSTKIVMARPATQAQRFQALEYRMAMLSRHFRPWLTSGACFVAKTSALRRILDTHSLWFPGEDIEVGRIAFALKMRVRHLDMDVETAGPETWRALFRQRRMWWAGSFRHSIINLDRNAIQLPVWSFYYVGLVWVGVYFKWHSLIGYFQPFVLVQSLAFLFAIYAIVTVIANWQVRSWRMLVFPPYALLQAILMPTVGSIYYFTLAHRQGNLGRYRFGYRRRAHASPIPAY
jgi:cellulose synthase/poly-beta-1,6-N-acetylglucosamine synthase-like glycosyltransferase